MRCHDRAAARLRLHRAYCVCALGTIGFRALFCARLGASRAAAVLRFEFWFFQNSKNGGQSMGFYYAHEKQKFDAEWERLSAWYQAEGMSAEAIRELYQYDCAVFCRQRSFENRTQPLPEEPASVLYQKFAQLTTMMTDTDLRGRYDWIESLDDEELAGRLKKLSADDRELLTQILEDSVEDEFNLWNEQIETAKESAREHGVTFVDVDIKPFQENCKKLHDMQDFRQYSF